MEKHTYNSMLTGYKDRVLRIALFDIFASLEKKQSKDAHNKPIDFFGLGLVSLLFFFESMLLRVKRRGVHELGQFIKETTQDALFTSDEDYAALARRIIEVFRPTQGKRNYRKFYNYEKQEWDKLEFSILKADDWDSVKNVQYYTLDEQGLELVFATKEYFSEFQISISQMMLRKQLEKGEFMSALRQVDEMRINVNSIKDNIIRIKHDIKRNITSEDTYSRYKGLIKEINERLVNEQDEFIELSQFIKETKGYMDKPEEHVDKDQRALELLVRIDNELAHVHFLHAALLNESIDLKTTALEAASESLYYAGITSFNFDAELARKMTTLPIPLMEAKQLAKPFLAINRFETWSPMAIFAPQMKEATNKQTFDLIFSELIENAVIDEVEGRKKAVSDTLYILKKGLVYNRSLGKDRLTLSDLMEIPILAEYLDTREFCETCVMLHQMSPIHVKEMLQQEEHLLYEGINRSFENEEIIFVCEVEKHLELGDHYTMRDIEIWTGGNQ